MDGNEPEMGQPCFQDLVNVRVCVEPVQESPHFAIEPFRRWRLKMNALFADRAGDNLHRASAVIASAAYLDFGHATAPSGKEGRMPCQKPFPCERLVIVACGIEHHFNDAFDMAVCRLQCANIHAEAARN